MNGPGFYWLTPGTNYLNFTDISIGGSEFTLLFEHRFEYTYPVGSLAIRYFDSEAEAREFHNLPPAPLEWMPSTSYAVGDKVLTEQGKLLFVVTAGTSGDNSPDSQQMMLLNDGSMQFAYIGDYYG